ncbi:MAG: hypothetical protein ABIF19_01075 [Planctomycetota bacterium]
MDESPPGLGPRGDGLRQMMDDGRHVPRLSSIVLTWAVTTGCKQQTYSPDSIPLVQGALIGDRLSPAYGL